MKYLLAVLVSLFSVVTISAQSYTVRPSKDVEKLALNDSITRTRVFYAGDCLSKSARCQYSAIALGVTSGLTALWASKAEDKAKTPIRVVSIVSGVSAVLTELFAIQWKMQAGKELKISAGELIYRF